MDKSLSISELRERRQIQWLKKLKRLQKVEDDYKQFPLLPIYKPRLVDAVPLWVTFFRQKQAFEYVASHQQDVHVFAFEVDNNLSDHKSLVKGQRKYCVTSYSQLWHVIKHSANRNKFVSFYEVIPEGATCKLYFDLEFNKEVNPKHDGKQMVQTLIQFVCDELNSIFQVQANIKHVLNLDASTEKKFSCHLIFNLPHVAFKDNLHQGNFVHHVCCRIRKVIEQRSENETKEVENTEDKNHEPITKIPKLDAFERNDQLPHLLVKGNDGKEGLFIDEGVYTKNRNFRLYKCSKLSKNNPLIEAEDNAYKPALNQLTGHNLEHQFFLDSIISNVSYSPKMRILTCEGCNRVFKKSFDIAGSDSGYNADRIEDVEEGYQKSPYPELDRFILSKVNRGGVQGEIRRWTYYAQGGMIVYIVKNRWCENIGRQHKSNNIKIIADLKKTVFYQKCLDPECCAVNFKSPDQDIPLEFLPSFDDLDDDELMEAADKYEATQRTSENDDGGIGDFLADDESDEFVEALDVLEKSIETENN